MQQLVAIDLPAGHEFVVALQRIWDRGDAALPIDQRLSASAKRALMVGMGVAAVYSPNDEHALGGGWAVESGDCLVMCTSGSSGSPKGVVLTHQAVAASAVATSARLETDSHDHWLACLPLAHVGGMSVVTRALHTGATLTVHAGFDASQVEAAAQQGANVTSLVPTALGRIDPYIFRKILLGGAQPPEHLPTNAVVTYGLTETGSGVVYDGVPLDGVEIQLDHDGQILIRGAMLLRAYRDGSSPIDQLGWLHTDDLGRFVDGS
jgi:o-succinylbenzoate---CoA ligase